MRARKLVFKCIRNIGRAFYKRRIWLISDRKTMAGDNGEAFFRFLNEKGVDAVFAISSKSKDYDRLKKIGKVVDYESLKHKFLLCVSDCHCSSHLIHMENHVETPQIFLQHGLLDHNISKMINDVSHDNFYFITGANSEYEQVCGRNYTIDPNNVWLTGFPRYDLLKSFPKKKVVIALTWRPYLKQLKKNEIFNTRYYKTLVTLIENNELNNLLNLYGYGVYIKLHPEMLYLKEYFPENYKCKIYEESYNKLYEEAEIMITDYSSTVYDFLYLKKPIIYFQNDGGEFFVNNPYVAPSMDYEKDGFGPVTRTMDELISALRHLLENGCVMDEVYTNRVEHLFAFKDKNNCERVYQKICEIIWKN